MGRALPATAVRALAAVRDEIGRRAAAGSDDAGMPAAAVAAALEARPEDRALLEAAAEERRRTDSGEDPGTDCGLRARRRRRTDEAHRALDALVLAGELVPDGPERLRLPGFGGTTWRAIAHLRAGAGGADGGWAAAVAAGPAADLGDAAPGFLRDLRPDPVRAEAARVLHAWEAARQDARHALIAASATLAGARERGDAAAARALRADCAALEARLDQVDAEIESAWERGWRLGSAA